MLDGACLLLVSYSAGPISIGSPAAGVFLASVIVFRLASDDGYREATFSAGPCGLRQLLYLMLVASLSVYVQGSGAPFFVGGAWPAYLTLLLFLMGASRAPRGLSWALVAGLAFGLWLRVSDRPSWPVFELIDVGYGISDPSVLVGALLALHGPAWMLRRNGGLIALGPMSTEPPPTEQRSKGADTKSWVSPTPALGSLPYVLLACGFVDVYFGLSLDVLPPRVSVSLFNLPGLMVVAFLIGMHGRGAGVRRAAMVLLLLVVVAGAVNLSAGSLDVRGQLAWGLRYSSNVLDVLQGAMVVAGFVWLGARVGVGGGQMWNQVATATGYAQPSAMLPQLRFAYMDVVLIVVAAGLLGLRSLAAIATFTGA